MITLNLVYDNKFLKNENDKIDGKKRLVKNN